MAAPNVQRVPKLLLAVNGWVASGAIDKAQGQALSNLTLAKHDPLLALADQIGTTPDAELLSQALAISASASSSSAASAPTATSADGGASAGAVKARKGRPALNIGAVKDANATAEAAAADEVESQADALLRAKRMRNLKRQSMPEKTGLPQSVSDQVQ